MTLSGHRACIGPRLHHRFCRTREFSSILRTDILSDAPKHRARIANREVSQAPRLIRHGLNHYAVLCNNALILDVAPPRIHILDEEMHHEIVSPFLKLLEQKARATVADVR